MESNTAKVLLVAGDAIARYGFPGGHPFGTDRHEAFMSELKKTGLDQQLLHADPRQATRAEIERFHSAGYIDLVMERSLSGVGLLDGADTPAFKGVYEAAANVVGSALVALDAIMTGSARRAFVPIAGLHHAARGSAAGFCVFNDCGVVIETLRRDYGVRRVAYVDIDAHHGDGVFYGFVDDPDLLFADMHEDGRHLYPGTGASEETGEGVAMGTKLNLPLPPLAGDAAFHEAWLEIERYLQAGKPDFVIFQCGADSVAEDPLTHLQFTPKAHTHAAQRLSVLAEEWGHGRVLALGGGGYNRRNLALAWTGVVSGLLNHRA